MTRQIALAALLALGAGAVQAASPGMTSDHLTVVDLNGDGAVDKAEYRVMASNVFILLDVDHDNKLTPEEAKSIPVVLFEQMDLDRDGFASRAEYDDQILADFVAADVDGDGLLN